IAPFYDPSVNPLTQPIGANNLDPRLYGGARRFPRNLRNGFVQQWNLTLEQKLGTNWSFSVGYVGSHRRNLQVVFLPINSAQLIDPTILAGWRTSYIANSAFNSLKNPATVAVCNPFQTLQTCNPASPASASGPLIPYGTGNIRNRTIATQE